MNESAVSDGKRVSVPTDLESSTAKLVYLYLANTDSATVEQLQTDLDISKLSLYSVLRTLGERGFVDTEDGYYVCR